MSIDSSFNVNMLITSNFFKQRPMSCDFGAWSNCGLGFNYSSLFNFSSPFASGGNFHNSFLNSALSSFSFSGVNSGLSGLGGYMNSAFSAFPSFGDYSGSAGFGQFNYANQFNFDNLGAFGNLTGYATNPIEENLTSQNIEDSSDMNLGEYSGTAEDLKKQWASRAPSLTDSFYQKTAKIADKIKCDPQALMALMYSESGFETTAQNPDPKSTATGLIQFTRRTAEGLGYTIEQVKRMSYMQQLNLVEKHLVGAKASAGYAPDEHISVGTLYALVFLPVRARDEVLTRRGENYYDGNQGLDYNKDGRITKGDLAAHLRSKIRF